jgi:hypothetical protein
VKNDLPSLFLVFEKYDAKEQGFSDMGNTLVRVFLGECFYFY